MRKTIPMLVLAFLLTVLAPFAQSSHAATLGEVHLWNASLTDANYMTWGLKGSVEVQNLAYSKKVTLVWSYNGSSSWNRVAATYAGPTTNNKEEWIFNAAIPKVNTSSGIKFYIMYEVNGQTYYDSNDGANYLIGGNTAPSVLIGKSYQVKLQNASFFSSSVSGNLYLKDLGSTKQVKIVYSTDNWKTTQTAYAQYAQVVGYTNGTVEEWTYSLPVSSTATQVTFAIEYGVGGVSNWDNNLGRNYTLTK